MTPARRLIWAVLACALLMAILASLLLGAGQFGPGQSLAYLLGDAGERANAQLDMVMMTLRLPRTVSALMVGGALGLSGCLMQAVTRNPLAEPGLMGVNGGSALGVVIGISWAGIQTGLGYLVFAALGALVGNLCVLGLAHATRHADAPLRLVLAGAALGATFHGLSASLLLASPNSLDQYRFWSQGSFSGVNLSQVAWVAPAMLIGIVAAAVLHKPLSALQLGDDMAQSLGHRPGPLRAATILTVTLLTGGAVALAGPIGFVGLVAPFAARKLAPPRLGSQLFAAAWLGALLLLVADEAIRVLMQPYETPVGVLTAILGTPLLIWMARQGRIERGMQ